MITSSVTVELSCGLLLLLRRDPARSDPVQGLHRRRAAQLGEQVHERPPVEVALFREGLVLGDDDVDGIVARSFNAASARW